MKIVAISKKERIEKFMPQTDFNKSLEITYYPLDYKNSNILKNDSDADAIIVDAIGRVDRELIKAMPRLRLIQSEGVGYDGVDVFAASENGIAVCNNKGINSSAVAEQTLMLILGVIKDCINSHHALYEGRQMEVKQSMMIKGVPELSEMTVGLIGMGNIAYETAKRLKAFGCRILYTNRTEKKDIEKELSIEYRTLDELLCESDIVSLHIALCEDTKRIADKAFFDKMKNGSYFINTSRGGLVDNEALINALNSEKLIRAGLDTLDPEPVTKDNILLSDSVNGKIIFSPHIGGITEATFKRGFEFVFSNIKALNDGNILKNKVN